MLPFIDGLNHYFGEKFYCFPEGFKSPPPYTNRTGYYDRLFYLRGNKEYEATAAFPNICIERAHQYSLQNNLHWKGYLLKGDDTFIFYKKPLFDNRFDQMWIRKKFDVYDTKTRCHSEGRNGAPTNCGPSVWDTWHQAKQIENTQLVLDFLRMSQDDLLRECASDLEKKLGTNKRAFYQQRGTDFVYIPIHFVEKFIILIRPFIKFKIIFETALPNVIECLRGQSNSTLLNVVAVNEIGPIRDQMIKDPHNSLMKAFTDNTAFLHPIKLRSMVQHDFTNNGSQENSNMFKHSLPALQATYCNDMLPYILND